MAYQSTYDDPSRDTNAFYRRTLHVLNDASVPFLVGGSHAFLNYTGIVRETKDFDLFVRRSLLQRLDDESSELPGGSGDCGGHLSRPGRGW